MITCPAWRGERYAVLGLARSGAATVRALLASGAAVVAWDSDQAKRDALSPSPLRGEGRGEGRPQAPSFETAPLPALSPGGRGLSIANPLEIDLTGFAAVVVSPGVPLNRHQIAARAREVDVPVIGDIELFAQARDYLPSHRVVGLARGEAEADWLEPLPLGGVYVLELSSYQIDLTHTLDCDVAVLLNITPDHLDRYDGFAGYAASKARLFAMQEKDHDAVIGIGDATSAAIARTLSSRGEHLHKIAPGVCMDQSRWPSLHGPHNAQNALAAIASCQALGVPEAAIDAGLESFKGLPHRMERVGVVNGVAYVNDSKATNPDSTAPALEAFDRVHWIVGGQAKTDNLDACRPAFGHVRAAYTIGEAGMLFRDLLRDAIPTTYAGTMADAVELARAAAEPGDTVLLSPACASFDQFRDYEDRGDTFRSMVEALA